MHRPAHLFQLGFALLVTLLVLLEFDGPVLHVLAGHAGLAMGAAVPKAAVDEQGYLLAGPGDVGAARHLPLQAVAGKARVVDALAYQQLGLGVGALVALHALAHGGGHLQLLAARAYGVAGHLAGDVLDVQAVNQSPRSIRFDFVLSLLFQAASVFVA